ncbi:uncharacterized protein BCR38DRAFT_344177 [Pseudomassariella vexata]|uniref:Glycosyltransferase family 31 protein n=1 Tax=Pseudomassariella vexata TaxID=1141098 RepID=A0A1Y2DUG5_9PEZI|nr:uncharacterized protein BCR38DRAFT_344177 [Pseudomassariella vexata]ORY62921.1 hypothetical protein BCR38DRAFT_344177 [Pseudomassariella vexata]
MIRPLYLAGRLRSFQILALFLVFCILLTSYRSYHGNHPPPSIYDYTDGNTAETRLNDTSTDPKASEEFRYLTDLVHQYGLTKDIPWFAQRIRPTFKSSSRSSMTKVSTRFLSHGLCRVRTEDDEGLELRAEKALQLSVSKSPTPDQIDASSLIFGISTSYDRIVYSNVSLINDWARWLTDGKGRSNGASLVLSLHHASKVEVGYVSTKMREVGIDAVVLSNDNHLDITARYVEMVRMLTHRNEELTKEGQEKNLLALVDDDVFFPSLGRLLGEVGKFDARKNLYLGMPSEAADWTTENNITMTYGGGAVFFSVPMAATLSKLPCLKNEGSDEAAYSQGNGQWDELLYSCVTRHTNEDLDVIPSFYVPKDGHYGLRTGYEGGVQPMTLHHYKHRHRFEPWKAHMVTSLCGEDCFLQRFWFKDGWILVNGHTISHYPEGVDVTPLKKSSLLMTQHNREEREVKTAKRLIVDDVEGRNDRNIVSWTGAKRTWRLIDARIGANGAVWQAYVKRRGPAISYGDDDDRLPDDKVHTQEKPSDVDSIIVLIWEP